MQEHIYRVNTTIDSRGPVLTSQRDRGAEEVFADGITALNVQYRRSTTRRAPPADLPANDAEWRLVKEVLLIGHGTIPDASPRRGLSPGDRELHGEAAKPAALTASQEVNFMITRMWRPIVSERGTALLFALTITALLFLLATSVAILTRSSTIIEVGHADTTQSFYYAEAGVNRGVAEFKNIFQGYNVPTGSDFNPRTFALSGAAVRYQLTAVPGYPQFVRIPAGKQVCGVEQHRLPVHERVADTRPGRHDESPARRPLPDPQRPVCSSSSPSTRTISRSCRGRR